MKTPRFSGPFKWSALRQQLLSLRQDIRSIQKVAGRNVTIDEHRGKGAVINARRDRATAGATTGACCADDGSCSITTIDGCIGIFQGIGTTCDPNPCQCCHISISGAGAAGVVDICDGSANYQFPFDIAFDCTGDSTCAGLTGCGPQTSTFTESGNHCPDESNQTTTFTVDSVTLSFSGSWTLHITVTATVDCGCGSITTTDTESFSLAVLNGVHSIGGTFGDQPSLHWVATITISSSCP